MPVKAENRSRVYTRNTRNSTDLVPFLHRYKNVGQTPLLRVISPFCEHIKKCQEMVPLTYTRLYEEKFEALTLDEVIEKSNLKLSYLGLLSFQEIINFHYTYV